MFHTFTLPSDDAVTNHTTSLSPLKPEGGENGFKHLMRVSCACNKNRVISLRNPTHNNIWAMQHCWRSSYLTMCKNRNEKELWKISSNKQKPQTRRTLNFNAQFPLGIWSTRTLPSLSPTTIHSWNGKARNSIVKICSEKFVSNTRFAEASS